ncbi:MAG TPA: hypothetical protein VIL20_11380 [Sandaracinaceae bacterium]
MWLAACAALLCACGAPPEEPRRAEHRAPGEAPAAGGEPSSAGSSDRAEGRDGLATGRDDRAAPAESEGPGEAGEPGPARGRPGPWTLERTLANAPFAAPRAPSVVVHATPSFDPAGPLHLVVFLHGWNGCARVLAGEGAIACRDGDRPREGWGLARRVDESGVPALFVVPQLAFLERSGDPGRFAEPGRFRAFLEELLAVLPVGDPSLDRVGSLVLLAHSAGFETALALVARGGVPIDAVVLFDALYRGVAPFLAWAGGAPERRLVSLYTGSGRTAQQSRMLAARARASLGEVAYDDPRPLAELLRAHRVVIARSAAPHGEVPARHLAELLPALVPEGVR